MKYLAIDVLRLVGVDSPEEKIGKMSVSIGGIAVNNTEKIINILGDVQVIVGADSYTFNLPTAQDEEHIKNVQEVKEKEGKFASEPYLAREETKKATPVE